MDPNNILSIHYTDDSHKQTAIEYESGNTITLTGAIIGCIVRNKEIREAIFNAIVNAIAMSDYPQKWLNAINNGVKTAKEKSASEMHDAIVS